MKSLSTLALSALCASLAIVPAQAAADNFLNFTVPDATGTLGITALAIVGLVALRRRFTK